jgi:hypothetical protein
MRLRSKGIEVSERVAEKPPRTLGRYEVQEEIGRGMMGVVYKALDPALGRTVALKTVCLGFSVPESERMMFEKRFQTEARVAAALSHPCIVVVHDTGHDVATGTLYIALEYLEGRTLADIAAQGPPMPWREALRLTARLADALHHAHCQGVIHRDVKPANIMVQPSGEPKIMDFGIAKVPTSQLTSVGEFFGTPSYMSPEQAAGGAVDGRSDLFSLGAVLYLLLTGRRAFDATSVPVILDLIAHKDPPIPSELNPELPAEVNPVVFRALAKDPAERYPDGKTFAEDLDDVREGRPPRHQQTVRAAQTVEGTWVSLEPLSEIEPVRGGSAAARGTRRSGSRLKDRLSGGGALGLGSAAIAGLLLALVLVQAPRPGVGNAAPGAPAAEPASTSGSSFQLPYLKQPAQLDVLFEHSARAGTLRLWVDDALALEEPLESHVVRKVLSVHIRKGTIHKAFEIAPGEHVIRVEVEADGHTESRQLRATFDSGAKRRLEINRGGLPLFKKELALDWAG